MRLLALITLALASALPVAAQEITLRMPPMLIELGFDKQILPRFKFKHRITVTPVTEGAADAELGTDGTRIFQEVDGETFKLAILAGEGEAKDHAATFLKWLQSTPGKAAIESFKPDGTQIFTTEVTKVVVKAPEVFEGDTVDGSRLALVHCGRCHVVDERNRMGGIGSSPSFAAMRARPDWSNLFRAFYTHNPHPSFTQVEGVTDPFDPNRQLSVAPMEITLEEVEAITAFVATIEPKNLGRPVEQK